MGSALTSEDANHQIGSKYRDMVLRYFHLGKKYDISAFANSHWPRTAPINIDGRLSAGSMVNQEKLAPSATDMEKKLQSGPK
jgi:hypothetical protein